MKFQGEKTTGTKELIVLTKFARLDGNRLFFLQYHLIVETHCAYMIGKMELENCGT